MSLKTIINKKNAHIDKLLADFEKEFLVESKWLKSELTSLFESGSFTKADIKTIFDSAGFGKNGIAEAFTNQYDDLLKYSGGLAKELGTGFPLRASSFEFLDKLEKHNLAKLLDANTSIINSMYDASLKYEVNQMTFKQVVSSLNDDIDLLGRRLSTEAHTGISSYSRAVNLEHFTEAGIERYTYFGDIIETSRDVCREVVGDPQNNDEGFTMDEIAGLSVDFISGGGYNCGHEFLPVVDE